MYKKLFFLIFIPVFLLFGCTSLKDEEINQNNGELVFKLDKMQLTKSFQQTQPFAQFKNRPSKNSERLGILVSAGLVESSGIEIDKIVKDNNQLDIYISNIQDEKSSIVVPQALVSLSREDIPHPDQIKLNIIGQDLDPINLKLAYNDALSIVESHFKISSLAQPQVNLLREEAGYYWQIDYETAFDKSQADYPLIAFKASVDATSGKILASNRRPLAQSLAKGNILGLYKNKYLAYKTRTQDKESPKEELWIYDDRTQSRDLLFTSSFQTSNLHFSPNNRYLSFIELGDKVSNLYIASDNKKAFRPSIRENINPIGHSWIDNNRICLIENKENRAQLYSLDINTNQIKDLAQLNNPIGNLSIMDQTYLYSDSDPAKTNNNIYITNDFKDFSLVASGYNPKFLNQDTIVYMEAKDKEEDRSLNFFSLGQSQLVKSIDGLIDSYQILDSSSIFYVEKSKQDSSYLLYKYSLGDKEPKLLRTSNTSKVFYNRRNGSFYMNFNSPVENDDNMLIYNIK